MAESLILAETAKRLGLTQDSAGSYTIDTPIGALALVYPCAGGYRVATTGETYPEESEALTAYGRGRKMLRDPRIDPRPGDHLRNKHNARKVDGCTSVVVSFVKQNGKRTSVWLATWKRWARTAIILHTAEPIE